jgi:hypothetical protein
MRNMLAFLAAAALALVAVGWYLDWFSLHTVPGESGHSRVTIDINTPKVRQDVHAAEEKIEKKLAAKNPPAASLSSEVPPAANTPADPVPPVIGKALRKVGDVLAPPAR